MAMTVTIAARARDRGAVAGISSVTTPPGETKVEA